MVKIQQLKFSKQLIALSSVILFFAILTIGCSKESTQTEEEALDEDPPVIIMTISEEALSFDYFEDNQLISIINEGNTAFNWNWNNNSNNFITTDHGSGTLNPGETIELNLSLNRSNLNNGIYNESVFINNQLQSIEIPIQVNHYNDKKWLIDGNVVDAEYDRIQDKMVVVFDGPNELRAYNMSNASVVNVALNLAPKCVSVSQDGSYAAVGHNGYISYINLSTMLVETVIPVTADAYDIILAPNNWVYVFPRDGQWERLRCVNLLNGLEYDHTGSSIRHRTKAKLHPSGNFIYGANTDSSPSDFEKYNISGGSANYLYDSPYHGDFAFSGDIWISDDGDRLFAKSRNVFNASVNQSNDMTYNGEIEGNGNIVTMDYSTNSGKVCVISTSDTWSDIPNNNVEIYESQYLGFQSTIDLPDFLLPDGDVGGDFYDAHGYYGFFNATGTSFFVLVKIEEGSNLQNEWAIATIDFD